MDDSLAMSFDLGVLWPMTCATNLTLRYFSKMERDDDKIITNYYDISEFYLNTIINTKKTYPIINYPFYISKVSGNNAVVMLYCMI